MVNQPATVVNTNALVNVPVGLDVVGNVQYNKQHVSLSPEFKELRIGTYYKTDNIVGYVERRQNYLGQNGINNDVVGILTNYSF
jgi:hypothetical protein